MQIVLSKIPSKEEGHLMFIYSCNILEKGPHKPG